MHKLAKLSDDERRRLITDFVDDAFGGFDANADFVDMMRSAMPRLPDDPEPDQVDAWVELAELTQDPDFRAAVRRMAVYQAAERARWFSQVRTELQKLRLSLLAGVAFLSLRRGVAGG